MPAAPRRRIIAWASACGSTVVDRGRSVRGVVLIRFAPYPRLLRGSMPKCLTPAQIEQYREEGCVFPIRIMSETEAAELRARLEVFEQQMGGPPGSLTGVGPARHPKRQC